MENKEKSELTKPTPEQYGWHNQGSFDDEPSGWLIEGGEEAFWEALEKWEKENEQKQ